MAQPYRVHAIGMSLTASNPSCVAVNGGTWRESWRKQLWSNSKNSFEISLEENNEQQVLGQTSLSPGFQPGPPECEVVVQIFHREV